MQLPNVKEGLEKLENLLETEMKKHGTISVSTDTGVLEALGPSVAWQATEHVGQEAAR